MSIPRVAKGIGVLVLLAGLTFTAVAQELVISRLNITKTSSVREVEPGLVEVVVALQDGSKATLRMNIFTARSLGMQLSRFGL